MPQALAIVFGNLALAVTAGASLSVSAAAFSLATAFGVAAGNLAIGVGLSLAASALGRSPAPPAPKPSDMSREIRQPVPARRKWYGINSNSGPVWWSEVMPSRNDPGGNNADMLFLGIAFNQGRVGEILSYHLDENEVTIDGTGLITAPSAYTGSAGRQAWLYSRLGLPRETQYDPIDTNFGVDNVRGDGVATVLAVLDDRGGSVQFALYPNGVPNLKVTHTGSVAWDPRDASQSRTDPSTWKSTENPIVAALDFCLSTEGYGFAFERIAPNLSAVMAEMDKCDAAVLRADGTTEPRYRLALGYDLTEDPKDVVTRILSACDGQIWPKRDGTIAITAGLYQAPTVTIESKDILGYDDLWFGQDRLTRIEGVRAQYLSPDNDYIEQEVEPWPSGDAVAELTDDRVMTLDFAVVPSATQARRLMKRAYLRASAPIRGTIVTNLAGLRAIDERWIRLVIDELEIDGPFEVGKYSIDPNSLRVTMEVRSLGPEIDAWDPASEEGAAPSNDPMVETLIDGAVQTPIGDMNVGPSMSTCFNGSTKIGFASCARSAAVGVGFIGLSFVSPRRLKRAVIYGSNDAGFDQGLSPSTIGISIYGSMGAAPPDVATAAAVGTLLAAPISFGDPSDASGGKLFYSNDRLTEWDNIYAVLTSSDSARSVYCCELQLYE